MQNEQASAFVRELQTVGTERILATVGATAATTAVTSVPSVAEVASGDAAASDDPDDEGWSYLVDFQGVFYDGLGTVSTLADPRETGGSSFSVTFNYKMPTDRYGHALIKTLTPYAPSALIDDLSQVCYAIFISGLTDVIEISSNTGGAFYSTYFSGTERTANDPFRCTIANSHLDSGNYRHLGFVSDGNIQKVYLDGVLQCEHTAAVPLVDCVGGAMRLGGAMHASQGTLMTSLEVRSISLVTLIVAVHPADLLVVSAGLGHEKVGHSSHGG